jgi:hypothetical protein
MRYAIWEGFIQTAFQTYVRELNKLELTIDTVCNPILVYHIESKFKQFKQYPTPENFKHKVSFFDKLNQFYKSNLVEIAPVVNTESNVGFKVLNRILKEFNLQTVPDYYPEPRSNYKLSTELKRLLDFRNDAAHGQNASIVKREDLDRAIKLVETLICI